MSSKNSDDKDIVYDIKNFYTDLTHLAENNLLMPFCGRDDIINEIVDVLNRKIKSNVILLGEPGVGKTAIVEGLASRIVNGKVPISLLGKKVYSLNIAELIAGSKYRGDFEERLNNVLKNIIDTGIKQYDAYHVACAILAKCDYFLSTDKRLLKYKTHDIYLLNPVDFLDVYGGNEK